MWDGQISCLSEKNDLQQEHEHKAVQTESRIKHEKHLSPRVLVLRLHTDPLKIDIVIHSQLSCVAPSPQDSVSLLCTPLRYTPPTRTEVPFLTGFFEHRTRAGVCGSQSKV